jgi:hypothetical protein
MKLKKFDRSDCQLRYDEKAVVAFEKSGIIRFNRTAVKHLKLEVGDKIAIYQDEERPRDWYIEKTDSETGLIMRKHSSPGSVCCNAKQITSVVQKAVKNEVKTMRFRIAALPVEEGQGLYAILTGAPV